MSESGFSIPSELIFEETGIVVTGGTGVPSQDAEVGSVYISTNGNTYQKKTAGAGAGNWEAAPTENSFDALTTEQAFLQAFVGKSADGDVDPSYSSGNHASGDLETAIGALDNVIGAAPTALTRTTGPIGQGSAYDDIDSLDTTIGADADLTPEVRTKGPVVLASSLYQKIDALDAVVGPDSSLVPEARSKGGTGTANSIYNNLSSLDEAIGNDAHLTPEARTAGPVTVAQSTMQNLDSLDTAIGPDVTSTSFLDAGSSVNSNLSTLDAQITNYLLLSGGTMTGAIALGGNLITGSGAPVSGSDLATKDFVESLAAGLDPKASVKAKTATAITGATFSASGGTGGTGEFTAVDLTDDVIFDDVPSASTFVVGDRIMVGSEADQSKNGLFVVTTAGAAGVIERAADHDGSPAAEVSSGNSAFVELGTLNEGSTWVLVGDGLLDLNVDDLIWNKHSQVGGLANVQIEIDSIETAVGLDSSGNFINFAGTNFLDPATSIANGFIRLDNKIGGDPVPQTRATGQVIQGETLNGNINAVDVAIGADVDLSPVVRTIGALSNAVSVYANLDSIDAAIGPDSSLSPVVRTKGPLSTGTNIYDNLDSVDTVIGADAELTVVTRTSGGLSAAATIYSNIGSLDDAVGGDADLTPQTRAVGQLSISNSLLSHIEGLDEAIGGDSSLSPEARTFSPVTTAFSTMQNLGQLDSAIGADVDLTPTTRTTGGIVQNSSLFQMVNAIDDAIGGDSSLTPVGRSFSPVGLAFSAMQNIDALDAAIGPNVTPAVRTNNPLSGSISLSENVDKVDSAIGSDSHLGASSLLSVTDSVNSNLASLAEAVESASTSVTASNITTSTVVDSVLVDEVAAVTWSISVQGNAEGDAPNKERFIYFCGHDGHNTGSGADAIVATGTKYGIVKMGSAITGLVVSVAHSGSAGAQVMELVVESTMAVDVSVSREPVPFA